VGAATLPAQTDEDESDVALPARPPAAARPLSHAAPAPRRGNIPPVPAQRFRERVADYGYVASDLRRIAVLAGSLVVLLVALSFVVR
jgi:hypothetical protein